MHDTVEKHGTRITHEQIMLTVSWEIAKDTRVTDLSCAVFA